MILFWAELIHKLNFAMGDPKKTNNLPKTPIDSRNPGDNRKISGWPQHSWISHKHFVNGLPKHKAIYIPRHYFSRPM